MPVQPIMKCFDLCSPDALNKSDLTAMLEYLYLHDKDFKNLFEHELIEALGTYDKFRMKNEARENAKYFYVEDYVIIILARLDGDGFDLEIWYDPIGAHEGEKPERPEDEKEDFPFGEPQWGLNPNIRPPKPRDVFYISPYEPFRFYERYKYLYGLNDGDRWFEDDWHFITNDHMIKDDWFEKDDDSNNGNPDGTIDDSSDISKSLEFYTSISKDTLANDIQLYFLAKIVGDCC